MLGIRYAEQLLPRHRVDDPRGETELFVRVSVRPAIYRHKDV